MKNILRSTHRGHPFFCMVLTTKTNYEQFSTQHYHTGFYSRDGECLLRGTRKLFKYVSS